ncbi:MAG: hypothetical protein MH252_05900 [Thermosynechococcaceae cyanobacterium MS004]|nr:hypothetical protein [Thermosynechococcaceae cyanobacterium MS004]
MTILIANIGTSDISIQIDKFYIPIGFQRDEPNICGPNPNTEESEVWSNLTNIVKYKVTELINLDIGTYPKFRFATEKVLGLYCDDPDKWHPLIKLGRLTGILDEALKFNDLSKIYLFVTDQPESEIEGHKKDTVFLFSLIKEWLRREYTNRLRDVEIDSETIEFRAIDQDKLFDFYYQFFIEKLNSNEPLLLSIKGGTFPMQTALRVIANEVGSQRQIFLEPQLDVTSLLRGEPSRCDRISFWQFTRIKKYKDIKLLLERWDFSGVEAILLEFRENLDFFKRQEVLGREKVSRTRDSINQSLILAQFAKSNFNLDINFNLRQAAVQNAQRLFLNDNTSEPQFLIRCLYAQCQILWELDQIVNFLPRMSTLCEKILEFLFDKIIVHSSYSFNDKILIWRAIEVFGEERWNQFTRRENRNSSIRKVTQDYYKEARRNPHNSLSIYFDFSRLNRISKRSFLNLLFSNTTLFDSWTTLNEYIERLDKWFEKRNDMIHQANGFSRQSLDSFYAQQSDEFRSAVCPPSQILDVLQNIIGSPLVVGNIIEDDYYIYSYLKTEISRIIDQDLRLTPLN